MTLYKYKNKLTNRESFYGNMKLLLKKEPVQIGKKFLSYTKLYYSISKTGKYEDSTVIITKHKLNTGNSK
jgi:hypothetical protein